MLFPLLILVFTLMASAVSARAAGAEGWVPTRWTGGPVEVFHRSRNKTLPADPRLRETVRQWYSPATLELLEGTPINCLLVTWSAGADPATEREQRRVVSNYVREAHKREIVVLGLVYPGAEAPAAGRSAAEAELDGLVMDGDFPAGERFGERVREALAGKGKAAVVFPITSLERLWREGQGPVLAVSDSLWPRVRVFSEGSSVTSGPSGDPWIDANGWRVRSLRARAGGRPVWLGHKPEKPGPEEYLRAVADAALAGGRWIVSLDDELRAGLYQKQPEVLATWRRLAAYLNFFEEHAEWRRLSPRARLAIVLHGAGENSALSGEVLNLFSRRHMPYRIIDRRDLSRAALSGTETVVAVDLEPPTAAERQMLADFAAAGGLVVAGPSWARGAAATQAYSVEMAGRGRMAIYSKAIPDPDTLSLDVLRLVGKEKLGLRLYNVSPILSDFASDSSGKRVLLGLLNYSEYPVESVTARISGEFRSARLYSPEAAVSDLPLEKTPQGVEIVIPQLSICAAVLLE
ncbi:MAG: hypothetical protein HY236_03825 [Acidobacteria bacterium]|nr:hypothetical protein [Acidobacteriota bacterium]